MKFEEALSQIDFKCVKECLIDIQLPSLVS